MQLSEKKKMSQGKLVGNIAILTAMTIALAAPAGAQTWQSLGKSATIPVVVENTACNSSVDTVGINADRTSLLYCQSGVWKQAPQTGGGGFRKWLDSQGLSRFPSYLYGVYNPGQIEILHAIQVDTRLNSIKYESWGNLRCLYDLTTGLLVEMGGLTYCPVLALDGRDYQQ